MSEHDGDAVFYDLGKLETALAQRDAMVKVLETIANHPENKTATRSDRSSYGVRWAFWNVQNLARDAIHAVVGEVSK